MSVHDGRMPTDPPRDELAERVVLAHVLNDRELIDSLDLTPLLTHEEHRWCWATMQRVHRELPLTAGYGEWFCRWFYEVEQIRPGLADVVLPYQQEIDRKFEEYELSALDEPRLSQYAHGFAYWLDRLQRIHEARRLISAAQTIAEHAWKAPTRSFTTAEAVQLIDRAATTTLPTVPPVWERADAI